MGPNSWPSGPLMVNSGMKAQTMISVEKNRARSISPECAEDPLLERQLGVFAGGQVAVDVLHHDDRAESTMMPKSTAPMESRLADLPRRNSTENANSSASGMLMATISAVRMLLMNMNRITVTRTMPMIRFSRDRLGGDVDQFGAVVISLDLDAGEHAAGFRVVQLLDLGLDLFQGRQGVLALAQQDDALDLVGLVVAMSRAGVVDDLVVRIVPVTRAGDGWPVS